MVLEAVAAALVGLAGLLLVLQPLFRAAPRAPQPPEPLDPEETPRGVALAALKEIDFDRETGKLSDADHQFLKARYTAVALEALRAESAGSTPEQLEAVIAARVREVRASSTDAIPRCKTCGPRPEPDAAFCSSCGHRLLGAPRNRSSLEPGPGMTPVERTSVLSQPAASHATHEAPQD